HRELHRLRERQGPAHLERPALPVVHDALEHRALRHPAGQAPRPERGDVRAGGRCLLPGDGGHPPDRPVRDAQAAAVTALQITLSAFCAVVALGLLVLIVRDRLPGTVTLVALATLEAGLVVQ